MLCTMTDARSSDPQITKLIEERHEAGSEWLDPLDSASDEPLTDDENAAGSAKTSPQDRGLPCCDPALIGEMDWH